MPPFPSDEMPPAAELGQHPAAVPARVVEALEHHHPAALAGDEALAALVIDVHVAGRERGRLGEAHELEGVEAHVHAATERDVELPGRDELGGGGHGEQRGGAGPVHHPAAAVQIEDVTHTPGDCVGEAAGEGVLGDPREDALPGLFERQLQLGALVGVEAGGERRVAERPPERGPAEAHGVGAGLLSGERVAEDHADAVAVHVLEVEAGALHRLFGDVEGEPMHHIGGLKGGAGHPVGGRIEAPTIDHRGPLAIGHILHRSVEAVVVGDRQPAVGHLPELLASSQDVLPQRSGVGRARVTASEADNGDGLDRAGHRGSEAGRGFTTGAGRVASLTCTDGRRVGRGAGDVPSDPG